MKECTGLVCQETLRIQSPAAASVHSGEETIKRSLFSHEVPGRPWQKLGADILEFRGENYLCVVDYYSKFPQVNLLSSTTSSSVVVNLKSIFARHGVPDELLADNMSFASRDLQDFASSWGYQLITSSPGYPRSNGMSERTIGTIKQPLTKAEDPYVDLMEYRNTPVTGIGLSLPRRCQTVGL